MYTIQIIMDNSVENQSYTSTFERRATFFFVFMGIVTITYGFFFLIDFLPEKPSETEIVATEESVDVTTDDVDTNTAIEPLPIRLVIDALDRDVTVLNPAGRTVEALDAALLEGVVRHPDSADFEHTGTIFLFGHSSYLPNVKNKNFQAFNGVQKLVWGDTIKLYSKDTEYVYQVDRVYEVSAENAEVKLEQGIEKLTLVTCDTFGAKSDRFVVEATLVAKKPIENKDSVGK